MKVIIGEQKVHFAELRTISVKRRAGKLFLLQIIIRKCKFDIFIIQEIQSTGWKYNINEQQNINKNVYSR